MATGSQVETIIGRRAFLTGLAAGAATLAGGPGLFGRAAGPLTAGAVKVDITPTLDGWIGGMNRSRVTQIHDPLHVRALALANGSSLLALAICDLPQVPGQMIDRAKDLIRRHLSISPDHILVSATHTHSAPRVANVFQSKIDPEYADWVVERIAQAVRTAADRLEPARVAWGTGRLADEVFNRRYHMKQGSIAPNPFGGTEDRVKTNPGRENPEVLRPAGPKDPEVTCLFVESTGGDPISVFASYPLHYVGGVPSGHVSADYFAVWAEELGRLSGACRAIGGPSFVPMLANGASGDINNINVGSTAQYPPYAKMREVAQKLAAETVRVWQTAEFRDRVELGADVSRLKLAVRQPSADEVAAARESLAGAPAAEQYRDRRQIYARETVLLSELYPREVEVPMQAMRVGDLGLAAFPGEAFVELGLEVKKKSPFPTTMVIGLANDYHGYIPTPEAHALGGYETWRAKSSYLEVQAAPRMISAALQGLKTLASAE